MLCGWIHLIEECPEVPYQPPKEEEQEYQIGPCWCCGQKGHYSKLCPELEMIKKTKNTRYTKACDSSVDEEIPYHVEITKPQMVGGYLYRPGSGVLKGKLRTGTRQSYLPSKSSTGVPKKEGTSDRRGVRRSTASSPSGKPEGYTGGTGGCFRWSTPR